MALINDEWQWVNWLISVLSGQVAQYDVMDLGQKSLGYGLTPLWPQATTWTNTTYCWLNIRKQTSEKFDAKYWTLLLEKKRIWKISAKRRPYGPDLNVFTSLGDILWYVTAFSISNHHWNIQSTAPGMNVLSIDNSAAMIISGPSISWFLHMRMYITLRSITAQLIISIFPECVTL